MAKRSAVFFVALILFILPAFSFAQSSSPVWFTLNAPEGSTVTASGPITLRFGQVASTCAAVMSSGPCSGVSVGSPSPEAWTNPQTFTPASGSSTVSVNVNTSSFQGVDPIPGVYKTVQIQEQANAQSILVNGQPVTVPGTSTSSGSGSSSSGWFLLNAPEGSVITASGPITLRFGQVASTCAVVAVSSGPCKGASPGASTPETWTSPQTFSPSGSPTVSVTVNAGSFGGVDPLPGVYKTVEIQQQGSAQTITVNGQSVTVPSTSGSSTPPSSGTWFTLSASEGSVVSASNAITLRFGQLASTCAVVSVSSGPCRGASPGAPTPETWTSPQTFSPSGSSTISVTVGPAAFGGVDPLPGVYKTVQILEQTNSQNITVNGQSVTVPGTSSSSTCQIVANPSSINFQNTTVGYTISSQGSLVSNCASTVTVNSVQVSGPYSISGVQAPFTLASGQSQNYTAVFAPTATGTSNGTVTFNSNASSSPSIPVTLTGTGVSASQSSTLSSSASSLNFGNVTVNSTQSQTLTISNSGSSSITVSSIGITGNGYSISGVATPFTLAANQSKQITVNFTPTTTGSLSGNVTVTSNAQNSSLTVNLSGTGASSASHYVTLSWNASSSVSGYNVYRSTVSGGPFTKINGSLVTGTSYNDNAVNGGTSYYYAVTAVGTNSAESGYSNQANVVVPSP